MKRVRKCINLILVFLICFTSLNFDAFVLNSNANSDAEIITPEQKFNNYLNTLEVNEDIVIERSLNSDDFIEKYEEFENECEDETTKAYDAYKKELFVKTTNPSIFKYIDANHVLKTTIKNDYFVYFETEDDLLKAKELIDKDPQTEFTDQNHEVEPGYSDDEEYDFEQSKSMLNTNASTYYSWGVERLKIDQYTNFMIENHVGEDVKVAVVDTGCDPANVLFNNNKLSYEDWKDVTDSSHTTPIDEHSHGTHVAGTIADATWNMPNIRIIPVKVRDGGGKLYSGNIYKGIVHACDRGATVCNLSLGATSPNTHSSYESAIKANVYRTTFTIASGNDGDYTQPYSPANSHDVISVSAIASNNKVASWSNGSEYVKFAAPGVGINSAVLGGKFGTKNGTSMAAPHIAALCSVIKSHHPNYQVHDMIEKMKATAVDLGDPGFDYRYGWGLPDASKLYQSFEVSFDSNGGSAINTTITAPYKGVYPTLPIPTKTGYNFVAWETPGGTYIHKGDPVKIAQDCTVKAVYEPKEFTITFDVDGGDMAAKTRTVWYDRQYTTLPTPTKTGYVFNYWQLPDGTIIRNGDTVKILADVKAKAIYAPKAITLTFNGNGGILSSTNMIVYYNSTYPALPTAEKSGYNFDGWQLPSGTMIKQGDTVKIMDNTQATAVYSLKDITVTFDAGEGTVSTNTITVTYTKNFPTLPTPVRPGYNFMGWKYENYYVYSGDRVSYVRDIILVAVYSPKQIEITFDANGGTLSQKSFKLTYGSTYPVLPIPKKTGYTFVGWRFSDNTYMVANETVTVTDNCTVVAEFTLKPITVTFNGNGGIVSRETISTGYNLQYPKLPTAKKDGYNFDGWKLPNGTIICEGDIVDIENDVVATATYSAKRFTITFNNSQGNVDVDPITVTYNQKYPSLPAPMKTGYTFVGWKLNDSEYIRQGLTVSILDDVEVVAVYSPIAINLKFNANGGSITTSSIKVSYDSKLPELPIPTKKGYIFINWQLYDGTVINKGDKVSSIKDLELYANYNAKQIKITLNSNEGIIGTSYIVVDYDSEYPVLPTPTKYGYNFVGWQYNEQFILFGNKVTNDFDYEINAIYIPIQKVLVLDPNGAELDTLEYQITFDEPYPVLPTPKKYGYKFDGWQFEDKSFLSEGEIFKSLDKIKLKAVFTIKDITITLSANGVIIGITSIKVKFNQPCPQLPTPTKYGYNFVGWQMSDKRFITEGQLIDIEDDFILNAIYTPKNFKLTLDADGGKINKSQIEVTYNDSYPTLPVPTKYGYKFEHWLIGSKTIIHEKKAVTIAADTSAKAVYTPKKIKITLNPQGGEVSKSTFGATFDQKYPTLPAPTKHGYDFVGWRFSDRTYYKEDALVKTEEDINAYAVYSARKSKITFNADGGITDIGELIVTYNSSYPQLPTPVKYGYNFIGWQIGDDAIIAENQTVQVAKDIEAKAIYESKNIKVYFNLNGGSFNNGNDATDDQLECLQNNYSAGANDNGLVFNIPFRSNLEANPIINMSTCDECGFNFTPFRKGYLFKGWAISKDSELFVDKTFTVQTEEDQTLYAIWEEVPQNIYVVYNKNTGEHLLTSNFGEYEKLGKNGWIKEGVAFENFIYQIESSTPIYRLYNPKHPGGDHHYTKSLGEVKKLMKAGWRWDNKEKPVFYAKGSVNVYRLYNKKNGRHHYTRKKGEYDKLGKNGWTKEGIAWQAYK